VHILVNDAVAVDVERTRWIIHVLEGRPDLSLSRLGTVALDATAILRFFVAAASKASF
jgi:hypothetical protein